MTDGEAFSFAVHVFYAGNPELESFIGAFSELAHAGLGAGRGRAALVRVEEAASGEAVWEHGQRLRAAVPLVLPLTGARECSAVTVHFITPTELKPAVERPEFGVLFARVRDRLSALRALYGDGPLAVDFLGLGERARAVRLADCDLREVTALRRSSRTGQTHGIGGFTGWARYEGEVGEFLPYLEAAQWTGVGRQTVWGKGVIAVSA